MRKKIIATSSGLLLLIAVAVAVYFYFVPLENEPVKPSPIPLQVSAFKSIDSQFTPIWDKHSSFFFSGAAVIDIDNDGKPEVFISNGKGKPDALLSYQKGKLVNIAKEANLNQDIANKESSYGAVSFDFDNDGDTDLLVARQDGIYLLTNNQGRFSQKKLNIKLPADSVPLQITIADIDNDGLVDLYVSNFVSPDKFHSGVFNDPVHAKPNLMLHNTGNLIFKDVTEQTGTAGTQNTFQSSFIDLNNDNKPDLVLANNTGHIEIFANKGQLHFTPVATHLGLGYWMGLGFADIDGDGDQDLFVSNIGSSIPKRFTRGDLRDDQKLNLHWALLENEGDFNFKDILKTHALGGYGFAWGGAFSDLNLDGKPDLLVAQNYIKWPPHRVHKLPGKSLLQVATKGKTGFYQNDDLNLANPFYGQSPLIVDLDNNGRPDVLWLNITQPVKAFLNTSNKPYVKLIIADNITYLGANVYLKTSTGKTYTQQLNDQAGLMTDQSHNAFFALPNNHETVTVYIELQNGKTKVIKDIQPNSTVVVH